ncbi:hypothetical protein DFR58_11546 [Anaerobacterium chartisolvens]|uniref:ATP synthase I subunit n=1 Tax=Anaerobacterium chartisolvens TaxID=1297424 RepID=A0A369AYT8_9FIRM|nr:hypothetical protein [Anaerobacterium chartisolvens]RCX14323.1 hypothetical protein DFR58_11546 [Anaerobacterium chartisolvens]
MEKFIARRVCVLFLLLAVLNLIFIESKWTVLFGLFAGGAFSLLRFSSQASFLSRVLVNGDRGTARRRVTLNYIMSQLAVIVLLTAAINLSFPLFAGVVAGILLVPAVIFINNITEILRVTHNNFE